MDLFQACKVFQACKAGQITQVQELIESGVNVNARHIYGIKSTALIYAAKNGHKEICELLIANGANVNDHDEYHFTALMYALGIGLYVPLDIDSEDCVSKIENGKLNVEICNLLIAHGANINEKICDEGSSFYQNENGPLLSPLTIASKDGREDICRFLIENGADVNVKDEDQDGFLLTPLMLASNNGHEDICRFLIENGADVNVKDKDGYSAFAYTLAFVPKKHKEKCRNMIELFVNMGADVNTKSHSGYTPLICAAAYGFKDLCQFLIEKGAEINTVGIEKKTALMWAAKRGHAEVCRLLINAGATVPALTEKEMTDYKLPWSELIEVV
jgi:ankyrin repeat protein